MGARTSSRSDDQNGSSRWLGRLSADPRIHIVNIGMACNLAIALAKLLGGWAFRSDIIVADGWHSMSDLVSDVLTLATVSLEVVAASSKSRRHIAVKNLGSMSLALMLLVGGASLGLKSLSHLRDHLHFSNTLQAGFSYDNPELAPSAPRLGAAWIAIGTIFTKQWLYKATLREACKLKSVALESNAAHHRMDSLSAMVALIAILGSKFVSNAVWIDAIGGVGVSCLIFWSGVGAVSHGLQNFSKI